MNSQLDPLIRRAILFLESGDWGSADDYCERVLDSNPENAYAYVVKLMARVKVCREEDLGNAADSYRNWNSFQNAYRFADDDLRERLDTYLDRVENRIKQKKEREKQDLERQRIAAREARLKHIYTIAMNHQKAGTEYFLTEAINLYESIVDYEDSRQKIEECRELLKQEHEKQQLIEAKIEKEKQKKTKQRAIILLAIAITLLAVAIFITINNGQINNQKALMIEKQLVGMSFSGTESDMVSTNNGGAITMITEMTEYDRIYYFKKDNSVSIDVTRRYDREPFLTQNGVRQWDSISHYTSSGTWGNVSVSLFGEITLTLDGTVCKLNVNSKNEPVSIVINDTEYRCRS